MKRNNLTMAGLALALLVLGWALPGQATDAAKGEKNTTSVFKIEGMTCAGCESGVKMVVKKLDGIESVQASYKKSQAEVTYDASQVTPKQIVAAIEKLGYKAELQAPPKKKS